MKKKLALHKDTIRVLTTESLDKVVAGGDTDLCTGTNCTNTCGRPTKIPDTDIGCPTGLCTYVC